MSSLTHWLLAARPKTLSVTLTPVLAGLALAWAEVLEASDIFIGVNAVDYSGYPDCREDTITALQKAISLGMDREFTIHTPLMHRSKKQTVELAVQLDALEAMALTHTCYNGRRPPCGECQACRLRAKGFREAGVKDPLLDLG